MNKLETAIFIGLSCFICCADPQNNGKGSKSDVADSEKKDSSIELILGERIDGPANARDSINGNVILDIEDNVLVQCSEIQEGWYQIGLVIPISGEQYKNNSIKRGEKIFGNGKLICRALRDIELWTVDENKGKDGSVKYAGIIGGYTFMDNIKPGTIVERQLETILNSGSKLTMERFTNHLKNFGYEKHELSIKGFENTEQYVVLGAWIDDPSPIDRVRLVFDSGELIAVVHERELKMNGKVSHKLSRGLEVLVIKDFDKSDLRQFIESINNAYSLID